MTCRVAVKRLAMLNAARLNITVIIRLLVRIDPFIFYTLFILFLMRSASNNVITPADTVAMNVFIFIVKL